MNDIFELGRANTPTVCASCCGILNSSAPESIELLRAFLEYVSEDGRLCINMYGYRLLPWLSNEQPYRNIFESAEHHTSSREEADAWLRHHLDAGYSARMALGSFFRDHTKFRYGSLYADGPGADTYGEYCVVLRPDVCQQIKIALVKHDSLSIETVDDEGNRRGYVNMTDGSLDFARLRPDIVCWQGRAAMALLKHENELIHQDRSRWATMLCLRDTYIEGVLDTELRPDLVECIRLPRTRLQKLMYLKGLMRSEEFEAAALFRDIYNAAKRLSIPVLAAIDA